MDHLYTKVDDDGNYVYPKWSPLPETAKGNPWVADPRSDWFKKQLFSCFKDCVVSVSIPGKVRVYYYIAKNGVVVDITEEYSKGTWAPG